MSEAALAGLLGGAITHQQAAALLEAADGNLERAVSLLLVCWRFTRGPPLEQLVGCPCDVVGARPSQIIAH